MKHIKLVYIFVIFLTGCFCGLTAHAKENPISPFVSFSSESISLGDTLLIKIKKEAGISGVYGVFLKKNIDFLKTTNGDWIGMVGFNPKRKTGSYKLTLNFSDGTNFNKTIKVNKRDFPTTKLLVTQQLADAGYSVKSIVKSSISDTAALAIAERYYSPTAFFSKPFQYPLTKIKSVGDFGNIRKSGTTAMQHLGVDLEAEEGTDVYASNDGVVSLVTELKDYGNTVVINHGLGIFTLYLHLEEFKVSIAQLVKKGDLVGLSGNTGYSIAPHLHFSLHVNNESVDPLVFIETTIVEMQ